MRTFYLFVLVCLGVASAKYLPNEENAVKASLWRLDETDSEELIRELLEGKQRNWELKRQQKLAEVEQKIQEKNDYIQRKLKGNLDEQKLRAEEVEKNIQENTDKAERKLQANLDEQKLRAEQIGQQLEKQGKDIAAKLDDAAIDSSEIAQQFVNLEDSWKNFVYGKWRDNLRRKFRLY